MYRYEESLTERQQQVLQVIEDNIALHGVPPTIAEIATAINVSSHNGVRDHLQALERKGAVELRPAQARGIRVIASQANQGLPIIGQVAAGSPILAQEHVESRVKVDAKMFNPAAHYLLRVKGMSMRDAGILDGDLLAVHKTQASRSGQVVVARIGDEVTVKRLRLEGHWAFLEPENPDFEIIKVDLRKTSLCIEGLGVGVIRDRYV